MTVFWVIALLLASAALLFVLPPLLSRPSAKTDDGGRGASLAVYRHGLAELQGDLDSGLLRPDQFTAARRDLERRLVEDMPDGGGGGSVADGVPRATAALVALVVVAGAFGVYGLLGSPRAVEPGADAPAPSAAAHSLAAEQMAAMVERLAARLAQDPGDAEGWHMLGRSYANIGRFPEAAKALAHAQELRPQDPNVLADLADVVAMLQGKSLSGRPRELIEAALRADPRHGKSLALAGTAAFNEGRYDDAIVWWEKLMRQLQPNSDQAKSLANSIAQARAAAAARAASPAAGATAGYPGSERISGRVRLAPALAGKLAADDTVFVFARAVDGPLAPLAVIRARGADLPLSFRLDDSHSMSPAARISQARQVTVGVRVSRGGSATSQAGDLLGTSSPVKPGTADVEIVIDSVAP